MAETVGTYDQALELMQTVGTTLGLANVVQAAQREGTAHTLVVYRTGDGFSEPGIVPEGQEKSLLYAEEDASSQPRDDVALVVYGRARDGSKDTHPAPTISEIDTAQAVEKQSQGHISGLVVPKLLVGGAGILLYRKLYNEAEDLTAGMSEFSWPRLTVDALRVAGYGVASFVFKPPNLRYKRAEEELKKLFPPE